MRNRTPAAPLVVVPPPGRRRLQAQDPSRRRAAAPSSPRATVPELHVVVLDAAAAASRRGRIVRVRARDLVPAAADAAGADESGGRGEFAAGARAAAVEVVGELAGDFGRHVAEEVGHGDEAGADDARGDFGDAVSRYGTSVSL